MPSSTSSPQLFPAFVAQHSVRFDPADPTDRRELFPALRLPESLRNAVRKRQVEYLAARQCAALAMRAFPEVIDTSVGIGPHREPIWPEGIVGAITHTHGIASVAVARKTQAHAVGLDIERIMDPHTAANVADSIASSDELAALSLGAGADSRDVLTAVFSAKETIFKCLFADVGRYFDFRDAEVTALDARSGRFSARLLVDLTPEYRAGLPLDGRFTFDATSVATGMLLRARVR